jgi:hypothetical protein
MWSGPLLAANKALLIGATKYQSSEYDLPGINLDLIEMRRVARKLGFEEKNISTLTGKDVTLKNLKQKFSGFLSEGVSPSDSVLVYYSGHGVQVPDKNGDEEDGADEAIALYDLKASFDSDGALNWSGVLADDDFSELLKDVVSENIIVIVDACHSGTVTRSYTRSIGAETRAYGDQQFAVKSLGVPRGVSKSGRVSGFASGGARGVITLSASQDHQRALASKKGSLFTLALAESLDQQRGTASPVSLIKSATSILEKRLDDDLLFHPNLTGDESLFDKSIVLNSDDGIENVNQSDMQSLIAGLSSLPLKTNKRVYANGDLIELEVDMPASGYVNIVAVDSDDQMVVLFPNGLDRDNRLTQKQVKLPGDRQFSWAAQAPWGSTMIAALYSEEPFSLFNASLQRTESGDPEADYLLPSMSSLQAFRNIVGKKAGGVVYVKTCENTDC